MSSSDRSARGFLTACAAAFVIVIGMLGGALLVVDPLGATSGNALCSAGAKNLDHAAAKSLVAYNRRPRTVVIGTSRVAKGFSRDAMAILGQAPVANLGISGGQPANFSVIADEALAGGRLERAFIGVDFSALHQRDEPAIEPSIASATYPELERVRVAFLSEAALHSLIFAPFDCRPRQRRDGAPVEARVQADSAPDMQSEAARLDLSLERTDPLRDERFITRLGQLRAMVRRLRRNNVEVVLFSAPYREELQALFSEHGLLDEFARFHAEVAQLAHEEGVRFVDLHDAGTRDLGLPACPDGRIGCHYLDLTHYGPLVGERLAVALTSHSSADRSK
jgi:hypothetical protein